MNLFIYGVLLAVLGCFVVVGVLLFITFAPLVLLFAAFGTVLFLLALWDDDGDPPYPGVAPSGLMNPWA